MEFNSGNQQLDHERDRLNDESPPLFSVSGETPWHANPGPDEVTRRYLRSEAHSKSNPINQFKSQVKRERERLEHQLVEARYGRRQTLRWDYSLDLRANPENNVRSRWVEQGIWGDDWGPAWPENSKPLTTKLGGGPFTPRLDMPGARWGHETPDPEPEPESESESESESEPATKRFGNSRTGRPKPRRRPIGIVHGLFGPAPRYAIPIPTVRNPEASRPYDQFMAQISHEREWIKDEMDYTAPGSVIDLDAMAYESVKNNWIEDGVWRPEWDDQPGRTWQHEEPLPEEDEAAPNTRDSENLATTGPSVERAVSTRGRTGGKRVGAAPIPLRRSARIAALAAKQAANVSTEPQRKQPRAAQTKTAKRGRGGRGRGRRNDTATPTTVAKKGARASRGKTRKRK